ncbi:MAG: hypothetical protein P4L27_08730 [Ignavibacteriaceae bacterium]|nr:hypothetical protein [Ignavibacteriaceae bacterium]
MKLKLFFLLVVSLLLSSCVSSSRIYYLKDPVVTKTDSLDVNAYEKKYPDVDGVCLNYERKIQHCGSINFFFNGQQWIYTSSVLYKVLVLNPKNEKMTTFKLPLNDERSLNKVYLKTTSPEGNVKLYNKSNLLLEKKSSGNIEYKFIYPDVKKGTIIEEGYELVYNLHAFNWAPMEHYIELQFLLPCEKFSFNYAFPKGVELKMKNISLNDTIKYKYDLDQKNNTKILSYSDTNIPEYAVEPFSPFYKESAKYLQFKVKSADIASLEYESIKGWDEVADHYKDFTKDRGSVFYSRIAPLTEQLTKNCKTDLEKLDSVVSYVQNNLEVDYSKPSTSYGEVLENKKGDMYTLTGMVYSILDKAGIAGDYILIHPVDEGFFDQNYISFDQFKYPAVRVFLNNKMYVVFPYIKNLPIDIIPDFLQNEIALIISKEVSQIVKITSDEFSYNALDDNYDITIDTTGRLTVNEVKIIKGFPAYQLRRNMPELNDDNKDKFVKSLLTYQGSEINVENFEILNRENYNEPLELRFKYTIDNLVSINPDDILFQTGGLLAPASLKIISLNSEKRKNPIKIYNYENNNKIITINFPKTWKVQTEFKDVNIENCFGTLASHTEVQDGVLKITKINNLKKTFQPKEKIKELCEVIGANPNSIVPTIIFQKK